MTLREIRESRGLTQVQVAEAMGITQPAVSKIESREVSNMKLSTVRRYVEGTGGVFEWRIR